MGLTANELMTTRKEEGGRRSLRRLLLGRTGVSLGTALASLVLVLLIIGSLWPARYLPYDPTTPDLVNRFLRPLQTGATGHFHLLGTDYLGRDMLSRLLYSGRYSLLLSIGASALATILAVAAGLSSGYLSGTYDVLMMRAVDALLSLPVILVAIVLAAVVGRGVLPLIVILAITGWADYTRVIRGEALGFRNALFVDAARTSGASEVRILARHILPNVVSSMTVMSTYLIARCILIESSISFLGMGIAPPASSWGEMIGEAREYIFTDPWVSVLPGLMITVTVLAVNFFGDAMRDRWDPHSRNR